jgi:uncharacterized nucleotidyltransferase DUF6036
VSAFSEALRLFLEELDGGLAFKPPLALYLIGGSAITLAYDEENRTADLDFIDPPELLVLRGGIGSALAQKYKVHVSGVSEINFSAPKDWRRHCRKLPISLKHLEIWTPSAEDIVLGKLARLEPKDFEDILSLRDLKRIVEKRLVHRLNQNKENLKLAEYRNNVRLLFAEVFGRVVSFEEGKLLLKSRKSFPA